MLILFYQIYNQLMNIAYNIHIPILFTLPIPLNANFKCIYDYMNYIKKKSVTL